MIIIVNIRQTPEFREFGECKCYLPKTASFKRLSVA